MVRWMCGVSLKVRVANDALRDRMGLECISVVMRRGRLKRFGRVERMEGDNWMNARPGGVRDANNELSNRMVLACTSVVMRRAD